MTFAKAPPRPKRQREDNFAGFTPKARPVAFAVVAREPAEAMPKAATFRSEKWRRAVAALPCVCCMREGETQAAHPNHRGKGLAMKASDAWCVPLCVACHRDFDQGARWGKHEKREMFDEWLILTINDLACRGLVKA